MEGRRKSKQECWGHKAALVPEAELCTCLGHPSTWLDDLYPWKRDGECDSSLRALGKVPAPTR